MQSRTTTIQSRTTTGLSQESTRNNNLLYYIAINDIDSIRRQNLVNRDNVNNLLLADIGNTALHQALIHSDGVIARYLLDLGANPDIKNSRGQTAFDVSMDLHKRYVFDYVISKKNERVKDLEDEVNKIKNSLEKESKARQFIAESLENFRTRVETLTTTNNLLQVEKKDLQMKNEELTSQNNRLKRKVKDLDETIEGFITKNKK